MVIPTPEFEPRLQRRYEKLVNGHLHTSENQAFGARALPSVNEAFASTQAAWRFYANPKISAQDLIAPLVEQAKLDLPVVSRRYGLAIHDWSDLVYARHSSKKDRKKIGTELGYKLATTLLISDLTGAPISPISLGLWANDGWHTTLDDQARSNLSPLGLVSETMLFLNCQKLPLPLVHIIDREGDSIFHYRQWDAAGDLFLVRADGVQRVVWQGRTQLLCDVASQVALRAGQAVEVSAQVIGQLFVGETSVVIERPAFPRGRDGKRQWVKGEPLTLRLVVCQLRLPDGTIEAEWYLLSNVPSDTRAEQLAEWYYWRWRIESYFKLLKSHGFRVDQWQQETADAIAKRLLVAAMACVVVWQLQRATEPEAIAMRDLLVRLSGRQVRRGHATAPAILAGLWVFLSAIELLDHYDLNDLKQMARLAVPGYS
ncbi:MAG: transposase [Blastocatellia bacterium]